MYDDAAEEKIFLYTYKVKDYFGRYMVTVEKKAQTHFK